MKLNILSGRNKNINGRFYKVDYAYYPIYAFFIGRDDLFDRNEDGSFITSEADCIQKIITKVVSYMDEPYINRVIKPFYDEQLQTWNYERLAGQMILIFNRLRLLNKDDREKAYVDIAKDIDIFSFGVVLLEYAKQLKKSPYSQYCNIIYEFIKNSLILNPCPIKFMSEREK